MPFPPFCTGGMCLQDTCKAARVCPHAAGSLHFDNVELVAAGEKSLLHFVRRRRRNGCAICLDGEGQNREDVFLPVPLAALAEGDFLALCGLDAEIPETRREGMRFPRDRLSKPIGAREGRGPFALSLSPAACMAGQGNFCLGKSHSPEQKSFPCNFCLHRIRFE